MGIIRGGLLVFSAVLLFVSLLFAGILLSVSSFLEYDNISKGMSSSLKSLIAENKDINQFFEDKLELAKVYCKTGNEFAFKYETYTFSVPCSVITQGKDSVVDYGVNFIVNSTYYSDYECEFFDCFEKTGTPAFLVSEKSRDYFRSKFYLASLISLVLLILMFLLAKKKGNFPIIAGISFVASAFVLFKFPEMISAISSLIFPSATMLSGILAVFFSGVTPVSVKMIIIGSALIVVWVLLKIFKLSFKIFSLAERIKEKRKEKKEATAKEKPVREKPAKDKSKKKPQKK